MTSLQLPVEPQPSRLLDCEAARRWMSLLDWGAAEDLYTFQFPVEGLAGPRASIGRRRLLLLSSYDYLGLLGHPRLEAAAVEAVRRSGTGTGGVRLLSGTNELHLSLEARLAAFKRVEAAATFTSGYMASLGVIAALFGPRDRVFVDAQAHRSTVDACRLAGVRVSRFEHNDPGSLAELLERRPASGRVLIVVEGTYSMDGDICPLADIVALKQRHGAFLMVDEAHSFGTLGATGRGIDEHCGLAPRDVDIWMGSLSKAIPSNGGFVAGRADLIRYLQHGAAPFMFSAALCPAATAAADAALQILEAEPERVRRAHANAARLRRALRELGYDTGRSETCIVPVLFGDEEAAFRAARDLLALGISASAVVRPAVAAGAARLRLCATAAHSVADLDEAIAAFRSLRRRVPATSTSPRVFRHLAARAEPSRAPAFGTRCFSHIDEVDPNEWDTLFSRDELQGTHRFIKTCQDSAVEGASYRHVLVHDDRGDLAAVATLSRMNVSLDLLSPRPVRALIQAARRLRPGLLRVPVVFCGLPVSFGRPCLALRDGVDRTAALRQLSAAAESFAAETDAAIVCFKEFAPAEDVRALEALGYIQAPSLPACALDLRWRSFAEYLAAMRAPYRRQALATLRVRQETGLTARVVDDLDAWSPRVFALYEQVMDRAEFQLERLNLEFFRQLGARLPGETSALLLELRGTLVAAAILLKSRRLHTFLLAGIDYTRHRECQAYPNLVLEIVAGAIRSGAKRLEMGQTSYALKGRLGGLTVPRTLYLRCRQRFAHAVLGRSHRLLFPDHPERPRRVFR
jgi:8-amino-7-oxononanoate synthase